MTKIEGPSGEKIAQKSRNSCRIYGRSCGCIGTVDSRPKCAHSYNQIQTLKECPCCHIYCAQLCAHLRAIVIASCAVSNRESQYPHPSPPCTLTLAPSLPSFYFLPSSTQIFGVDFRTTSKLTDLSPHGCFPSPKWPPRMGPQFYSQVSVH